MVISIPQGFLARRQNNFGHFGLVDVFLQGPVASAIAIGIRVDVVGLDAIALLIDPGVVVGGGILGDQAGVGIEAFLLIERVIAPVIGGSAACVHRILGAGHGHVRAALQGGVEVLVLLLAHRLGLLERAVLRLHLAVCSRASVTDHFRAT